MSTAAEEAHLLQGEPEALKDLITQWSSGDFQSIPEIVLLDGADMNGALGAYAVSTGKIYLNQDWLVGASTDQVIAVLTEELGHHLDILLNTSDILGDEGENFPHILGNHRLDDKTIGLPMRQRDSAFSSASGRTASELVQDTNAPVLVSYELSTYDIDLSAGDTVIGISARITDDISGVFDGTYTSGLGSSASQARWTSPSGKQFLDAGYFANPSSGSPNDAYFTDQTTLSRFAENGIWTLDSFLVADEAGNIKSLAKQDLDLLGIQTAFNVTGGVTLGSAPTDLTLTSGEILENSTAGTVIGILAATDTDADSTFTYELGACRA